MADNKVFLPDFANMCVKSGDTTLFAPWLDKRFHNRDLVEGVDFKINKVSDNVEDAFKANWYSTVPLSPAEEATCVLGCKMFTGGEIKHHPDCPFYPDSLSEMIDKMQPAQPPAGEGKGEGKTIIYNGMHLPISNPSKAIAMLMAEYIAGENYEYDYNAYKSGTTSWNEVEDPERHSEDGPEIDTTHELYLKFEKWAKEKFPILFTSSPTYPAGFVEWIREMFTDGKIGMGADRYDWEGKYMTVSELYSGPYQTYLQTKKG